MLARQNSKTLTCFEASLHGLKKRGGGANGGAAPPISYLQAECSHDGFQKGLIYCEVSLHGSKKQGGGWGGPVAKRMLAWRLL